MKSKNIDIDALPDEARKALSQFTEFEIGSFNDSGANGYVMIGHHKVLKKNVAIKIYFHDEGEVDQEPSLVAGIHHDNVLKVYDARKVEASCSYYMMPAANEGDLATFLSEYYISSSLAHKLLCQLLAGLAALHAPSTRLVHRDLKPENLLVHDDTLFIADFGSVRKIGEHTTKAPASKHSILYRPPEAFGDNGFFDFSSDVYQAGIVGYLLFGGALSNDLLSYMTDKERKAFAEIKKTGGSYEEACFVDSCIESRIKKATLLDWNSMPCFLPSPLIRAIKRAVKPHGKRYSSVSEFLAELAKARNNLPEWMDTDEGCLLENWKGNDYLLCEEYGQTIVKKRRTGKMDFRRDNGISPGALRDVFNALRNKLELP